MTHHKPGLRISNLGLLNIDSFLEMLSADLKWRIVYLMWDGYSTREISALLYISQSTVSRVIRLYSETGSVSACATRSRAQMMRPDDVVHLLRTLEKNPTLHMQELQEVVNDYRLESNLKPVSLSTIFRSVQVTDGLQDDL
jgi:transposase